MPVHANWYDAKENIIHQVFTGKWTLDEYFESYTLSTKMIQDANGRVDVLLDQTAASHLVPPNAMFHARRMVNMGNMKFPNWGLGVFVSKWRMHYALYEVGRKLDKSYRKHIRICETIDDALKIIRTSREEKEFIIEG